MDHVADIRYSDGKSDLTQIQRGYEKCSVGATRLPEEGKRREVERGFGESMSRLMLEEMSFIIVLVNVAKDQCAKYKGVHGGHETP